MSTMARKSNAVHQWYRQVFEKSGAASIIIEPDMTIAMANVEFEKLSGFARQDIEHRMKWSQFVFPEDLDAMVAYYHDAGAP